MQLSECENEGFFQHYVNRLVTANHWSITADWLSAAAGTRTTDRTGSGFRSGESSRPEVQLALIRKTRIQTSVVVQDLKRPAGDKRRTRRKIHPSVVAGRGLIINTSISISILTSINTSINTPINTSIGLSESDLMIVKLIDLIDSLLNHKLITDQ